ncbi:hypothetical protein J4729_04435 [Leisingera sp. HS039]|uniref:hypothetical protein n=1 Tax=unclassified Leisingera TaxID=2614906 RepID=UPI00107127B4|nr:MULTISPECIES: hypothetical protein [unclassified Leisingera]MBQ4823800.1 hypothetical protein [Leisingera sp. HS039]QBR35267.1 hypothetical protein ETW23_02910 [Leisingera sp. NJS201]
MATMRGPTSNSLAAVKRSTHQVTRVSLRPAFRYTKGRSITRASRVILQPRELWTWERQTVTLIDIANYFAGKGQPHFCARTCRPCSAGQQIRPNKAVQSFITLSRPNIMCIYIVIKIL